MPVSVLSASATTFLRSREPATCLYIHCKSVQVFKVWTGKCTNSLEALYARSLSPPLHSCVYELDFTFTPLTDSCTLPHTSQNSAHTLHIYAEAPRTEATRSGQECVSPPAGGNRTRPAPRPVFFGRDTLLLILKVQ